MKTRILRRAGLLALLAGVLSFAFLAPEVSARNALQAQGHADDGNGFHAEFNAVNANGNVAGHYYVTFVNGSGQVITEHAKITCLAIYGNIAAIGLEFTGGDDPGRPIGTGALVWAQDNGATGDLTDASGVLSAGPTVCPPPPIPPHVPWPGRIIVRD
jgi:hypothetical protein